MLIDKSTFLVLVGALAAGGGGGYLAAKQGLAARPEPGPQPVPPLAAVVTIAPPSASAMPTVALPTLPVCDDRDGTPGTCPPPMYSSDESGCGPLPNKRCGAFKDAMKPKVAERAVACLNSLKPGDRCDTNRINLCGHVALMSACEEAAAAVPPARDEVGASCQSIVEACAGTSTTPTVRDCRTTLTGMTESGRMHAVDCMKKHCSDKGLLGCEATGDPPT